VKVIRLIFAIGFGKVAAQQASFSKGQPKSFGP